MRKLLLITLLFAGMLARAEAAQWKNWAANPPPLGRWVMAQHPMVPGTFNLDPASVPPGADMSNVQWMDWTVADPSPLLLVPVLQFKELFTADEFDAIKASADHKVVQFLDWVNTPSLTYVDLRGPIVTGGIPYLQSIGLLTAPRAAAILAGTPPG